MSRKTKFRLNDGDGGPNGYATVVSGAAPVAAAADINQY